MESDFVTTMTSRMSAGNWGRRFDFRLIGVGVQGDVILDRVKTLLDAKYPEFQCFKDISLHGSRITGSHPNSFSLMGGASVYSTNISLDTRSGNNPKLAIRGLNQSEILGKAQVGQVVSVLDKFKQYVSADNAILRDINWQSGFAMIVVVRLNSDASEKAMRKFGRHLRKTHRLSYPRRHATSAIEGVSGTPRGWRVHCGLILPK